MYEVQPRQKDPVPESFAGSYETGTVVEVDNHVAFVVCATADSFVRQFVRLSMSGHQHTNKMALMIWPADKGLVVTRVLGDLQHRI